MKEMTVSEVSRNLGISTRMLRYYEKAGLFTSGRREGYSYRIYDENAVERIRQILLLRKLRIPVSQIEVILQNENAIVAIEIFRQNMEGIDEEITALSTIRDILAQFVKELSAATKLSLKQNIFQEDRILSTMESLQLTSKNTKQNPTAEKLQRADKQLSKIKDVRILYLPPATIAAAHYLGDDPEFHANTMLDNFVREYSLKDRKPDLRRYGFNHPNPVDETGYHGYEAWVSIPEDMEVPSPLEKKQFSGGLYAAHMIAFGNFNEWDDFLAWVMQSEAYEFAGDLQDQEHMCGLLEEHLNYFSHIAEPKQGEEQLQLDLLIPIKEKTI